MIILLISTGQHLLCRIVCNSSTSKIRHMPGTSELHRCWSILREANLELVIKRPLCKIKEFLCNLKVYLSYYMTKEVEKVFQFDQTCNFYDKVWIFFFGVKGGCISSLTSHRVVTQWISPGSITLVLNVLQSCSQRIVPWLKSYF